MKKLYLVCLFFFISQHISAQFLDTKNITVADGLISNNIQSTYIDSDNMLWLGSRAGLFYKEGTHYIISETANKYRFNNISDIIEDNKRTKWIASFGQGILVFNSSKDKLINQNSGLIDNAVRILFYHNDTVYAGTQNGISMINTQDFSISNPKFPKNSKHFLLATSFFTINNKVYVTTLNDGIFLVTAKKLHKVSDIKKIFSSTVIQNKLYLGTQTNLLELDIHNFQVLKQFNQPNINNFLTLNNVSHFISNGIFENNGGFFSLSNGEVTDLTQTFKIPFVDLKSICFDAKNQFLYIGTQDNGLIQINLNAQVNHLNTQTKVQTFSIIDKKIFSLHANGLTISKNQKNLKNIPLSTFKTFQEKNVNKFKNHTVIENHFYPIDYQTPASNIIFYSSQIHNNNLWVATNIGLFELNSNGKFISYHPIHIFHFIFFKNQLITAVPYAGVRIFSDIYNMKYSYVHDWNNQEVPSEIVSVAKTNQVVYFASALTGLYQYKNGVFTSFLNNKTFNEAKLKRIFVNENQQLIVVTDYNEVYYLDVSEEKPKLIKHISHQKIKGSTTYFVYEIDGVLFIGTNEGINVFYKDAYYLIDKAQGFTNYNSVMAAAKNEELFIATKGGIFQLNNSYFKKQLKKTDSIQLENLFVNNKLFEVNKEQWLELPYNKNNLQLNFLSVNTKYPDKIRIKYRLKPDEPWQNLSNRNQINLNYLNNGLYQIELQISNLASGVISYQKLLTVQIKPPFYLTVPFFITVILLVLLFGYVILRFRISYLNNKQKRELAIIELQNEKINKELLFEKQLSDVKLQALKSQMNSHFLFNVLNSIQYFILSKDVDNALYYLEQFSSLIRTTLDFSDKKYISLYQEISYLQQYIEIENLRAEYPIEFELQIEKQLKIEEIQITPLLLQPFVENAIVHAFPASIQKPVITLYISKEDLFYKLILSDNGIGYKTNKTSKHESKGISIVEKRLQLTQKKLQRPIEIQTNIKGTSITIYLDCDLPFTQ